MSSPNCCRAGQWSLVLFIACIAALAATRALAERPGKTSDDQSAPPPSFVPDSADNPATPEKVSLGKQLFFDPRLSGDNSMNCATCHLPDKAFTDGRPQAKGRHGKALARNVPTLLNAGFQSRLMWDGRADSLEQQALLPIHSPDEMNQDLGELERELSAVPEYAAQFMKVFGTAVTRQGIAKALAAFERTLVMKPSRYDRYVRGERDALSPAAERGRELFFGEAGCARCHKGPLLSDGKFYRLGIPGDDQGRAHVTGRKDDKGKFKTPPLRNVELTAPYMHDGSFKTLEDVVTYYYRTAPTATVDSLPLDVEPLLGRSYSEVADLVAFLCALTGPAPTITPPRLPALRQE